MNFELGVKSDPVEYRYSYEWLFALLQENGVSYLQLGSFFEMYSLPDEYFDDLRSLALSYGIRIKSLFTSHRELGGFFSGNEHMEAVARKSYERLIAVSALLGADYAGSNPGAVYRDKLNKKEQGLLRYNAHMQELSHMAKEAGLKGLTVEPMSSLAEPPSTPDEISSMMTGLNAYHRLNAEATVPVYLCGDISHGVADEKKNVIHGNMDLFNFALPWMCEFHFKNTDSIFNSTFGFSAEERERGIVNIEKVVNVVHGRATDWPVQDVVGYLEMGGPKLGRDYSDYLLGSQLTESLKYISGVMKDASSRS